MWNDADIEAAWRPPPYEADRAFTVYAASKASAGKALWEFVEREKPAFAVNAILPNTNMGEILSEKQGASTGKMVLALYIGNLGAYASVLPQWMVNIKDTARLHVAARVFEDVVGERVLAFDRAYNYSDILGVLRRFVSGRTFPRDVEGEERDLSEVDNERGRELLRRLGREERTGLEEMVRDNVKHLERK